MKQIQNLLLVVLTKNEVECVGNILPRLPRPSHEAGFDSVIVVDGGSTDGTVEVFQKAGYRVLQQSQKGRGEGIIQAIRELDFDAVLFFSPDGNEDPRDISKFRKYLEQGYDVVIASRMMAGAQNEEDHLVFRWRKWANLSFNMIANVLFRRDGSFLTDSLNGFRAFTRESILSLDLTAPDYTIEYQMIIRMFKKRLKFVEFPTIEGQGIAGQTGAPSIPTGLRFIRRLGLEILSSNIK